MTIKKEWLGILVAIGTAIFFGIYPATVRGAYADGANVVFIILLTTFFRTASTVAFCKLKGYKLFQSKTSVKTALNNGLFQTATIIGILGGMAYLPGPVVITILFSSTIMIYAFSVINGDEKPNALTLICVLSALAGLALSVGIHHNLDGLTFMGIGLSLMAAISTATRLYRYSQLSKQSHPIIIGAETFTFTLLFCCALMLYELPILPTTTQGWAFSFISATTLAIANFGMFYGVSMLGAFRYAFISKLEPIFTTLFAFLIIHEALSPLQYCGIALVVISLTAYQALNSRKPKAIK